MALWERKIRCSPSTLTYWQNQPRFSDTDLDDVSGTLGVSKVTVTYGRITPSGTQEDLVSFNLHMAIVAGANCSKLTDSQKTDAESDLANFCIAIEAAMSLAFERRDFIWHD